MKTKIKELLKQYKAKDIEEDEDSIAFYIKQIKVYIQIETEDDCQFWIEEVIGVELPTTYYNNILEYGDLSDFESFLARINDGEYNYIKGLYNSLLKLSEKYEYEFDIMLKYFG